MLDHLSDTSRRAAVIHSMSEEPKSLGIPAVRNARLAALQLPHIAPLSAFVHSLRGQMGPGHHIPYVDPADGGIHADCLFLLEAPGPQAVQSSFVSRDNPDESAKNFFLLNREAGIIRERTIVWNIVPWYVGSGTKIRPVHARDILAAAPALKDLLFLLPFLHSIVLVGRKANLARNTLSILAPKTALHPVPHPSPLYVNRSPTNRHTLLAALLQVAGNLPLNAVKCEPSRRDHA